MSNKSGRTTLLNKDRLDRVCSALRAGNTRRAAAAYAGIDDGTFLEWMRRGQGNDKVRPKTDLYAEFADAVKKAEAESEVALVATVRTAAQRAWQASAWLLERRFPDSWAAVEKRAEALALTKAAEPVSSEDLMSVLAQLPPDVLEAALKAKRPTG